MKVSAFIEMLQDECQDDDPEVCIKVSEWVYEAQEWQSTPLDVDTAYRSGGKVIVNTLR